MVLVASEVVNLMTLACEIGGVAIALQLLSGLPYRWLILIAVEIFVKDLGIALLEAKEMKLSLPMVALAEQLYIALQAQGHGRLGTQAITKVYESIRK